MVLTNFILYILFTISFNVINVPILGESFTIGDTLTYRMVKLSKYVIN